MHREAKASSGREIDHELELCRTAAASLSYLSGHLP